VAATAAIRDLHRQHPKFQVYVQTPFSKLFWYSPHVTAATECRDSIQDVLCDLDYSQGVHESQQGSGEHFIGWFHRQLSEALNVTIVPEDPYPSLFLSRMEREHAPISGRYWVMMAGGKSDITIKHWPSARYQAVVDALYREGIRVVQSGAEGINHIHPPLDNVLSVIGWGSLRALLWQIYHAEGVICPVTCAMHVAAAFQKPCVVLGGGREEPSWAAYSEQFGGFHHFTERLAVQHRYLHSFGQLDCCLTRGCWKKTVQTLRDPNDPLQCLRPVWANTVTTAECMARIGVSDVTSAVLSYYGPDGLPSPTGEPVSFVGPVVYS
jgi:hypothetical protein